MSMLPAPMSMPRELLGREGGGRRRARPPPLPDRFLLTMASPSGISTHSGSPAYAVEWSAPSVGGGRLLAFATDLGDVSVVDMGRDSSWFARDRDAVCLWPTRNAAFDVAWMGETPRLATAGGDLNVRVLDVGRGTSNPEVVWSHILHKGSVKSLSCCPNLPHILASGGRDGKIFVCDTRLPAPPQAPSSGEGCSGRSLQFGHAPKKSCGGSITAVRWLPCGRYLLAGQQDGCVRAYDVRMSMAAVPGAQAHGQGQGQEQSLRLDSHPVHSHCRRGRKRPLSTAVANRCGLAPSPPSTRQGHELLESLVGKRCDGVSSLTVTACGSRVAVGLVSGVVSLYKVVGGSALAHEANCLGGDRGSFFNRSSMSPCGNYVVGKRGRQAIIWDISTPRAVPDQPFMPTVQLVGHSAEVTATAWSKHVGDLQLATCGDDRMVRSWSSVGQQKDADMEVCRCNLQNQPSHGPGHFMSYVPGQSAGYALPATN
jgi:WD40 repeat protein